MTKKLYTVYGGRDRWESHGWFGSQVRAPWRKWGTFIETRSLRHAEAQYRRLKIADRQIDVDETGKSRRVHKWGKMR